SLGSSAMCSYGSSQTKQEVVISRLAKKRDTRRVTARGPLKQSWYTLIAIILGSEILNIIDGGISGRTIISVGCAVVLLQRVRGLGLRLTSSALEVHRLGRT